MATKYKKNNKNVMKLYKKKTKKRTKMQKNMLTN